MPPSDLSVAAFFIGGGFGMRAVKVGWAYTTTSRVRHLFVRRPDDLRLSCSLCKKYVLSYPTVVELVSEKRKGPNCKICEKRFVRKQMCIGGKELVMGDLKNCPFCGGKAMLDKELRDGCKDEDFEAYAYYYRCISCASQGGWAKSPTSAEKLWNMRKGV